MLWFTIYGIAHRWSWPSDRSPGPPSRVSAWRYNGQTTPIEYGDNQWFCGGRNTQIVNGGKCGICGDNWSDPQPRASEAGGIFAYPKGKIVKTYTKGQIMEATIDITANHCGYFEFRLCPTANPFVPVTQECLDQNLLQLSDGSGDKFHIPVCDKTRQTAKPAKKFKVQLQLPLDFSCDHCVLQWRYWTANHKESCGDGTESWHCGDQEEFRACADITITNDDGGVIYTRPPPIVGSTTTTTTTEASNGPIPDGDCNSSSTGYIRDPNDCSRFYQCVPAVGGGLKKEPKNCGPGTVFNPAIPGCDWPYNVPGC